MGHLYYIGLGNSAHENPRNDGPFINVQSYYYWYNTELSSSPDNYAWYFMFGSGFQLDDPKWAKKYAWAVRDGDPALCVNTSEGLQNALTIAKDNGKDDIIKIQQGTYNGNFVYISTEEHNLTIEGGYGDDDGPDGYPTFVDTEDPSTRMD